MDEECVDVRCCDLTVCVGSVDVIQNVTFDCCGGEWVVLTGPSDAPKTALLRAINGLCPPSAGEVWAFGSWMPGRRRREEAEVRRRTSITASVLAGFDPSGLSRAEQRREAHSWLEREGQRIALARALAPKPTLLILDEPTAHLDDGSARIVLAAVKDLVQQGATVVMASHREDDAVMWQTCRIVLDGGHVVSVCD
jgi:ABC-type multidrug transport system ATPase subunit